MERQARVATAARWLGLAGTSLLAVAGFLAGARIDAPAGRNEALWGLDGWFRLGLVAFLGGLVLLGWAWWQLGAVLRSPAPLRQRWLLGTGALWAAPLLVAPPLGSRDLYAYACQGAIWLDGHDPYAVGAAGGGCPWWSSVPELWQDSTTPYGPLALLASALAVGLARAVTSDPTGQLVVALGGLRAVAVLGAVLVAAGLPRLARGCRVPPAVASWLGLLTPLVAVHVVSGGHNDALVAGLLVIGLAALVPVRPGSVVLLAVAAGVAIGLAVAVKVTAVAALPFAAVLAVRYGARPVAGLLAGAFAGFAGVTAATGLGLGWVAALTGTGSMVQWSSPPTGVGMAAGYLLRGLGAPGGYDGAVTVARVLGVVALVVISAVALGQAWRRRDDVRAVALRCGVVLAAVVLLGPVVYPWYAVAPLAVLAAAVTGWRTRRWLAVATLVLTALTLPSGLGVPSQTKLPGAFLVAGLAAWLGWAWLRRRRRSRPPASDHGSRVCQ